MSLTILYSDRIEDLAEDLKRTLLEARTREGADPIGFSLKIAVGNCVRHRRIESALRCFLWKSSARQRKSDLSEHMEQYM